MNEDQVFQCPKCGEANHFKIDAVIQTVAYVNGHAEVDDAQDGDMDWNEDSRMECLPCEHVATVKEFEIP